MKLLMREKTELSKLLWEDSGEEGRFRWRPTGIIINDNKGFRSGTFKLKLQSQTRFIADFPLLIH